MWYCQALRSRLFHCWRLKDSPWHYNDKEVASGGSVVLRVNFVFSVAGTAGARVGSAQSNAGPLR